MNKNPVAREILATVSAIGVMCAGTAAAASPSGSAAALTFLVAGCGFASVFIYYLFVRGVEDTNKNKE